MFRIYEYNFSSTIELVTAALLVATILAVSLIGCCSCRAPQDSSSAPAPSSPAYSLLLRACEPGCRGRPGAKPIRYWLRSSAATRVKVGASSSVFCSSK